MEPLAPARVSPAAVAVQNTFGGSPMTAKLFVPVLAILAMALAGCETTSGNSQADNETLNNRARSSLKEMESKDSSLQNAVNNAYGYVIFPEVGKAAVGIGGSGGKGVVYQGGQQVGYAVLNQGSLGPQVGGETYSELITFKDSNSMASFRNGDLTLGADASATAVKAGAAAATQFKNGTEVFVLPKGGLMAGASINGQVIHFMADQNSSSSTNSGT
jgi:lipid-binding SYLF domain-containing protein